MKINAKIFSVNILLIFFITIFFYGETQNSFTRLLLFSLIVVAAIIFIINYSKIITPKTKTSFIKKTTIPAILYTILILYSGEQHSEKAGILLFISATIYLLAWIKSYKKSPKRNNLLEKLKKEKKAHLILLASTFALFLTFNLIHLGKFLSVDEPKWIEVRTPNLYQAIQEKNWEKTYINDKPGALPAFLAGTITSFLDYNNYKSNPLIYENYLLLYRLPGILVNSILLIPIYLLTRKVFNKRTALISIIIIGLHPILIGTSQIVNPDSMLWALSTISFLSFFAYLKTSNKKYILYSGIALGFGLLSKFFITLFFIIFPLIIYIQYLRKNETIENFFKRLKSFFALTSIAIVIFTIFFPATWTNSEYILLGTIGAEILKKGLMPFMLIFGLLIFEMTFLKQKFSKKLQKTDITKKIIAISSITFLTISLILISNIIFNNYFFDFNEYIPEKGTNIKIIFANIIASSFSTLLTLSYPTLISFTIFIATIFNKKLWKNKEHKKLFLSSTAMLYSVFILGSALGGYIANPRYQIMLYPIFAICSAVIITTIFNKKILQISTIIFSLSLLSLLNSLPFYFHFTNILNKNNYWITEAWGFGGYEIAQEMNKLDNATNITTWIDREGFDVFFVGKTLWRNIDPVKNKNQIDYYILTHRGKERVKKIADTKERQQKMQIYEKTPEFELCINNNPNNCVWATKK